MNVRKIIAVFALFVASIAARASFVTNSFIDSGLGSTNILVVFQPTSTPLLLTNGQTVYSNPIKATATNGILTPTWVGAGNYNVQFGPQHDVWQIAVPSDTNTYSLWQLATNINTTTNLAKLSGVTSIIGIGGITVFPSGTVYTIGGSGGGSVVSSATNKSGQSFSLTLITNISDGSITFSNTVVTNVITNSSLIPINLLAGLFSAGQIQDLVTAPATNNLKVVFAGDSLTAEGVPSAPPPLQTATNYSLWISNGFPGCSYAALNMYQGTNSAIFGQTSYGLMTNFAAEIGNNISKPNSGTNTIVSLWIGENDILQNTNASLTFANISNMVSWCHASNTTCKVVLFTTSANALGLSTTNQAALNTLIKNASGLWDYLVPVDEIQPLAIDPSQFVDLQIHFTTYWQQQIAQAWIGVIIRAAHSYPTFVHPPVIGQNSLYTRVHLAVGPTNAVGTPFVAHIAGGLGDFVYSTLDWSQGTVGSGMSISTGANTGQTWSGLQAYTNGGSSATALIMQFLGGNVGIGRTDPPNILSLSNNGSTLIDARNAQAPSGFNFGVLTDSNGYIYNNNANSHIFFGIGGSIAADLGTAGNLFVGGSNATYKIQALTQGNGNVGKYESTNASGTVFDIVSDDYKGGVVLRLYGQSNVVGGAWSHNGTNNQTVLGIGLGLPNGVVPGIAVDEGTGDVGIGGWAGTANVATIYAGLTRPMLVSTKFITNGASGSALEEYLTADSGDASSILQAVIQGGNDPGVLELNPFGGAVQAAGGISMLNSTITIGGLSASNFFATNFWYTVSNGVVVASVTNGNLNVTTSLKVQGSNIYTLLPGANVTFATNGNEMTVSATGGGGSLNFPTNNLNTALTNFNVGAAWISNSLTLSNNAVAGLIQVVGVSATNVFQTNGGYVVSNGVVVAGITNGGVFGIAIAGTNYYFNGANASSTGLIWSNGANGQMVLAPSPTGGGGGGQNQSPLLSVINGNSFGFTNLTNITVGTAATSASNVFGSNYWSQWLAGAVVAGESNGVFSGNGSLLTSLTAGNLTGTIPSASLQFATNNLNLAVTNVFFSTNNIDTAITNNEAAATAILNSITLSNNAVSGLLRVAGISVTNVETTNASYILSNGIAASGMSNGAVYATSSILIQGSNIYTLLPGANMAFATNGNEMTIAPLSGSFIASLNGNGTNTTLTNFTFSGNGMNNGIVVTNTGTNVESYLYYTNTITNELNGNGGTGICWTDRGDFDWEHNGGWVLNMGGFLNFAVAGSIAMSSETGVMSLGSSGTFSLASQGAMRFTAGVQDALTINLIPNQTSEGLPVNYQSRFGAGNFTNVFYQIFSLGANRIGAGESNYIATVAQTNSIATASSTLVYTNNNFDFVFGTQMFSFGPGTNAHEMVYYSMSGQSLDGTIEYETDTPGLAMLTNNGTAWGVLTNRPPTFVGIGTPTGITAFASQTGLAFYSTAASTVSHQNVFTASLKPMTR